MPRTTHPAPRGGHSRTHVRAQAERYGLRRWRHVKNRYGANWAVAPANPDDPSRIMWRARGDAPQFVHPEDIRHGRTDMHSSLWLMNMSLWELADGPMTYCSCGLCTHHSWDDHPRGEQRAAWRAECDEDEAELPAPGRRSFSRHSRQMQRTARW
jgi:hypothetical protein